MGVPILSEIVAVVIGIWQNSPDWFKKILFMALLVFIVGILAWFFDTPMDFTIPLTDTAIFSKPPMPHRIFMPAECLAAQAAVTNSSIGDCHQRDIDDFNGCMEDISLNKGNTTCTCVIQWNGYDNETNSLNDCYVSACYEGLGGLSFGTLLGGNPVCTYNSFITPEGENTTYVNYCRNIIFNQDIDLTAQYATLEACKGMGFDFLNWQLLLILEIMFILGQFALKYYGVFIKQV